MDLGIAKRILGMDIFFIGGKIVLTIISEGLSEQSS